MSKSNKFSSEARERRVRMVQQHRGEYPSLWAAIESIDPKIGRVPQTLHEWVKRVEVDTGVREGMTTSEAQRVKDLEREVSRFPLARGWAGVHQSSHRLSKVSSQVTLWSVGRSGPTPRSTSSDCTASTS